MTSELSSELDWFLSATQEQQEAFLNSLSEDQAEELLSMLPLWRPQPGPQTLALNSQADILGYGGQAGGGKTDLALGAAATQHYRSIVFRRVFPSLSQLIDRSHELYGKHATYNGSGHVWTFEDGRKVRFGSLQHETDVTDFQGQPHDLYVFEEAPEFTEKQFRFVIGWNRSTRPGQRCRVILTFNPPTTQDGRWIVKFFAPWLDKKHPKPAVPGELRYFTTDARGNEIEVPDDTPMLVNGFLVKPLSRTFIPAKLSDNAFLASTNYAATLNALPEPLRSKMLFGDFEFGNEDDAMQVIPTAWVLAAQERWKARPRPQGPMTALGADVARGGKDESTLAPRYGNYFDTLVTKPGTETRDSDSYAAFVLGVVGPTTLVKIDVIGVGSGPYDELRKHIGDRAVPMNASEGTEELDAAGVLGFVNERARWHWNMREALDPKSGQDIALPPDPMLLGDLTAARWKLTARGIQIESKDEIKLRLGRSPDRGDAVVMSNAHKAMPGAGLLEFMRLQAEEKAAQDKARRP